MLVQADFYQASLFGATLKDANLTGANFTAADLREANFETAQLDGACLPIWEPSCFEEGGANPVLFTDASRLQQRQ